MYEKTLYNLIARELAGEITADEKRRLQRWLAASDENAHLYERLKELWQQSQVPEPDELPDVRQEWLALQKALTSAPEPSLPRRLVATFAERLAGAVTVYRHPAAAALALLLLIAVGLGLWKLYFSGPQWQTVATAYGQKATVALSDGSTIKLNCGSSVRFARRFSDTLRQVFLSGEAYFDVKHDGRPFRVITANAVTSVLGTRFDVWARHGETRVVVAQGRVRLAPRNNESAGVMLVRNQVSRIVGSRSPQSPEAVNADNLLAWLDNRLVFEKTPLSEIIGELERTFDVRIELADSAIGQKTLTADFDTMQINSIIGSICMTLNLHHISTTKKIIIF